MELGEEAQVLLKPHWEKIVENWGGKIPEFVSLDYVKKYLPLLQIPDEEEGILIRACKVIEQCQNNEVYSLYMFLVLRYGAKMKVSFT